ncbi:hypothetical protein [Salipaludibacillus daqingensis]|uniref:hypothetical protein n=1 Tax=Salipaludibacillus daqingensis TaxID=3041001 RepID=UPI002475EC2F|nr:hypothetical protein [Salipaludibacillus daqingensis]
MNKYFIGSIITSLFFLVGCHSSDSISSSELDEYVVSQTTDETIQDDFIFRLVSEKKEYNEGEEVALYGEIEYIGEKDEVTIYHSSSAVLFPMEEKIRGYDIGFAVDDIGLSTTLKQGEPYQEKYVKSGSYSPDQDPEDYVSFIRDFLNRDDFPSGYYVVGAYADFSVDAEENEGSRERFKIEAAVDFKVIE